MWRARIEQATAAGYLSEFERRVLADYWVTDEEYAQSRAHIPECMEAAGFNSVIDNSRGTVATSAIPGFWDGVPQDEVEHEMTAALQACEDGFSEVELYYWDMRSNPQGWDFWEALTACAERLGLSEGVGMSTEELKVATLESEEFLAECRSDPWSLAQGREPVGGPDVGD